MNAGTAVFLIVLVLIGSFAGLGYLINQVTDTQAQITDLESRLTQCQSEKTICQDGLKACTTEKDTVNQQLIAVTAERNQTQAELRACQQTCTTRGTPNEVWNPFNTTITRSGLGSNTITWLVLATLFIAMVTGWGIVLRSVRLTQPERSRHPLSHPEQPVTVKMTRQQMKEYVAWQRRNK